MFDDDSDYGFVETYPQEVSYENAIVEADVFVQWFHQMFLGASVHPCRPLYIISDEVTMSKQCNEPESSGGLVERLFLEPKTNVQVTLLHERYRATYCQLNDSGPS